MACGVQDCVTCLQTKVQVDFQISSANPQILLIFWRQACVAWPRAPFTLTESPPTSSTRSLLLRSKFFSVEKAKQKQKQKMSKTRRKVDISGSLPQSSGKQVWTGSRSLHRLGWVCAVYPGRTRLRSVSARRLQHQVSGCMGSGSFQICRSERRRVRPFKLIVQFWEHSSEQLSRPCFEWDPIKRE